MKIGHSVSGFSRSLARRIRRAFGRRGELGSALIEFAVTMPLLMTVLTGTASFSVALYWLQQIANATSGAVNYVGSNAVLTSDPCKDSVTQVTDALPNLTASKLTYTLVISYPNSSDTATETTTYGPTTGSGFSCTAGAALLTANYPVTLTVSYAYSWLPVLNFTPKSSLAATEAALAE